MREIKFRAKAIENVETHIDSIEIGDWVYGYYYFDRANMTGIIVTDLLEESGGIGSGIMQCHIKVDPETVGEYTGLKDKNGYTEIFEYDIIDENGIVKGNYYENKYLLEKPINFLIKRMGTKEWKSTEQEADKRGCKYAE